MLVVELFWSWIVGGCDHCFSIHVNETILQIAIYWVFYHWFSVSFYISCFKSAIIPIDIFYRVWWLNECYQLRLKRLLRYMYFLNIQHVLDQIFFSTFNFYQFYSNVRSEALSKLSSLIFNASFKFLFISLWFNCDNVEITYAHEFNALYTIDDTAHNWQIYNSFAWILFTQWNIMLKFYFQLH